PVATARPAPGEKGDTSTGPGQGFCRGPIQRLRPFGRILAPTPTIRATRRPGHTFMDHLAQVLILLAVAIGVVISFQRLHIPTSLGYLLVGVILGPFTL